MKAKGDFVGSWWAKPTSNGKPLANSPGDGCGHLRGSAGSYATTGSSSNPHARPGKKIANNPGEGAGHQSRTPVGGKSGMGRKPMGKMKMGGY